jgi:hypothetical protein
VARVDTNCSTLCANPIPNLFGAPGPDCAYGVSVAPDNDAYVVGCMADAAGVPYAFVARANVDCFPFCIMPVREIAGALTPGCAYGVSAGPDDFAYVAGCYLSPLDGSTHAFVARVDPGCGTLCAMNIPNLFLVPGPDCGLGIAVGRDNNAYEVGYMTNPTGFTSAFVARANPVCGVPCVNGIPNFFGL